MASGRYGGRPSDNAGTRDYATRIDPISWTERVVNSRMDAALPAFFGPDGMCSSSRRAQDYALDFALDVSSEWIACRYGEFQGLEVGKTYVFKGRRGRVLEKREADGRHTASGLPRIRVEWLK
jgi:hypothetical protein